ncbi:MAG: glycerol-3-phosphate dehydrogenase, partial [Clostridia bacterium]|nr:glycerol-3-phosphate dehydrogenase [Clostridia bacterium]
MNFTLLGCGRWGSFIAWYLNKNNNNVTVWGRAGEPSIETLLANRKNDYVEFPESIELTTDLKYALS